MNSDLLLIYIVFLYELICIRDGQFHHGFHNAVVNCYIVSVAPDF